MMKRPAFTLLILAMVICIQAAGCYNPSFDGPGGFICERDGKCPGGYECCSMTGDDVCKPVGQCGKATDLGPSKDVKQDKNQISNDGKPDKTQISSDSNPDKTASPEQMVGIDKGLTNTCNYNEIVTSKYNANVQHFAMALDPNGQPQVFFIEANSNKIMHATRGSKWTIKPGPADPASRLAASLDSNGVIHLAARNEPAVAKDPRYLRHYFKVSSSSGWKYKKVDIVETGDSVDIASSGTLTYIAATQNSVGNKSWKVYKVLGSGSAFSTMTWYNYGSGINLFDGRVAVGAAKVASVAVGGGNWNIWTGTHKSPVSQKSTTIKRGSSEFQMGIAIDAAGTTWLAYAPDSSAFMGPLNVSIWKATSSSPSLDKTLQTTAIVSPASVSIALDDVGWPHVAWMEKAGAGLSLKWAKKSAGNWSVPSGFISGGLFSETKIAVAPITGYVHITYGNIVGKLYHACRKP